MLSASGDSRDEGGGYGLRAGGVDHRIYARFSLDAPATIWRDCATVKGRVVNVSLGGAYIRVVPTLPMHEAVLVTIHDSAKPVGVLNDLPATVVRTNDEGCAVRFDRMLLERSIADSLNGPLFGIR